MCKIAIKLEWTFLTFKSADWWLWVLFRGSRGQAADSVMLWGSSLMLADHILKSRWHIRVPSESKRGLSCFPLPGENREKSCRVSPAVLPWCASARVSHPTILAVRPEKWLSAFPAVTEDMERTHMSRLDWGRDSMGVRGLGSIKRAALVMSMHSGRRITAERVCGLAIRGDSGVWERRWRAELERRGGGFRQ